MERRKKNIPTGVGIQNQGFHMFREENEIGACIRKLDKSF